MMNKLKQRTEMFKPPEGGDGLYLLVPGFYSGSVIWAKALNAAESRYDSDYTLDVPAKLMLDNAASPHNVCKRASNFLGGINVK